MSDKFQDELREKVAGFTRRTLFAGEKIAEQALQFTEKEEWSRTDLWTIAAVLEALPEGQFHASLRPENIWLHRMQKPEYLDLVSRRIGNHLHIFGQALDIRYHYRSFGYRRTPTFFEDDTGQYLFLPNGGIYALVSTDDVITNPHYRQGDMPIRINLSEVLEVNGKIYRDLCSFVTGAVLIALPSGFSVPFEVATPFRYTRKRKCKHFAEFIFAKWRNLCAGFN